MFRGQAARLNMAERPAKRLKIDFGNDYGKLAFSLPPTTTVQAALGHATRKLAVAGKAVTSLALPGQIMLDPSESIGDVVDDELLTAKLAAVPGLPVAVPAPAPHAIQSCE